MDNLEIRKCLERKDGVKMVIVPKDSKIKKDDYVGIFKINKKKIKKENYKEVKQWQTKKKLKNIR